MIDYAKSELARIEHDEEGMQDEMDKCILQLLEVLEKQGHSNHSIYYCLCLFERLAKFKPITPLTGDDDEWNEIANNKFQNKRCSSVFKEGKDGKAYDIEGKVFSEDGGNTWYSNRDSLVYIDFPYVVPDASQKVIKEKPSIDKTGAEWCTLFKDQNGNLRSVEERALIRLLGKEGYSIDFIRHMLSFKEAENANRKNSKGNYR